MDFTAYLPGAGASRLKQDMSMTLRIPVSSPFLSYVLILAFVHMSCAREIVVARNDAGVGAGPRPGRAGWAHLGHLRGKGGANHFGTFPNALAMHTVSYVSVMVYPVPPLATLS